MLMDSSLIFACSNSESGENRLIKISVDVDKQKTCLIEPIFVNENTRIIAFEMDTEDN